MIDFYRLFGTFQRLRTFQHKRIEDIKHDQLIRLKKLLNYAYQRVPMYREFYDTKRFEPAFVNNYEDIEKIPIITKDIIKSFSFEDRVAKDVSKNNITRETTSGSTGEPLEIWSDQTESLIQAMKGIRLLKNWGYSFFYNTVQLWREDVEPKKSIIQKFGLFRRELISIMDEPDKVIENLRQSRCDVLYSTRSSLEIFGNELVKRNIKIEPRILISACELLTDEQKGFFKKTFECDTLEVYGCIEAGNIAWGCPKNPNNLHIDMETVLVSFSDIKNSSNGNKYASINVTNLENFVMPFINYDLNDLVLLPEDNQCSCGRTLPILGKILGRNDDIIEYKGRRYNFHIFYNFFKNFLYISKYQISQMRDGNIEFRIQLLNDNKNNRKKCISDLTNAFGRFFAPLNVRFVEGFAVPVTGKFKVIEKEI